MRTTIMFKSLTFKVFLVLFGVLLLAFFIFGLWINNLIKNMHIERAKTAVAGSIQTHARMFLEPQSFVFGSEQASRERFIYFFNIVRTSEIVRIKVWDTESRVIFSDDKSVIGKYFPENNELKTSLEGRVEAIIQKPVKPENIGEAGYAQLLEVYVPVYFQKNTRPVGAIEAYFNLDELNALLSKIRSFIFIVMSSVSAGVFIAVWLLFRFLIQRRLASIVHAAHEIAGGNLEIRAAVRGQDEIGELATAFNFMAAKLKELYSGLDQKVQDRTKKLEKDLKLMVGRELKMIELKKEIEAMKKQLENNIGNEKK